MYAGGAHCLFFIGAILSPGKENFKETGPKTGVQTNGKGGGSVGPVSPNKNAQKKERHGQVVNSNTLTAGRPVANPNEL